MKELKELLGKTVTIDEGTSCRVEKVYSGVIQCDYCSSFISRGQVVLSSYIDGSYSHLNCGKCESGKRELNYFLGALSRADESEGKL